MAVLKEDGTYLLQEDAFKILLENDGSVFVPPPPVMVPRNQAVQRAAVR